MTTRPLLRQDLDHVLSHAEPIWQELAGARLFIPGGTGFFGKWILESIAYANEMLGVDIRATILSRNPQHFLAAEMPHLGDKVEFSWVAADVRNFDFPHERYDYILHLATFTSAYIEKIEPAEMLAAKFMATRRVLDFARHCGTRRVLVASSGAVYGQQPATLKKIPEDYEGAPNPLLPSSAYGNGKRLVEQLCAISPDVDHVIARCFSFLGPHLPLDARYAAGNFLRDAISGGPIRVCGNGLSRRSYLYPADLIVWMLTLLKKGSSRQAYNVGSDEILSTKELADQISMQVSAAPVIVENTDRSGASTNSYIPDITRARSELGLNVVIKLPEAIERTTNWLQSKT